MKGRLWGFGIGNMGERVGVCGKDGVIFGEEAGCEGEALEVRTKPNVPVYVVFED